MKKLNQAVWPFLGEDMNNCFTYHLEGLNKINCYGQLMNYVGAHLGVLNSKSASKKPYAFLALVAENYFHPCDAAEGHLTLARNNLKPKQLMNSQCVARACLKFFERYPDSPLTILGKNGLDSYDGDI